MAQVVGAFGVPHTPMYPLQAREDTPLGHEIGRLYGEVATRLSELAPDVLVVFSTDHFHTFFADLPIFAIGIAESTYGPSDQPDLPAYSVPVDHSLARHLLSHTVKAGFDVAMSQEFTLDHTFMVPYHFLARELKVPIVPVFVNGLVAPTPTAARCLALGAQLAEGIDASGEAKRVAILASGSFSLDLGGIHEGGPDGGVPDSPWVDEVVTYLRESKRSELISETTDERMAKAGNIGGELLNWIAMLGTFAPTAPTYLERQGTIGHAYGAWDLSGGT